MALAITRLRLDEQAGAPGDGDPFALRAEPGAGDGAHVFGSGIRCDTESRGRKTPHDHSPAEIVLDASEGFIPLWAKGVTLRWRFRESSLTPFQNPDLARAQVEQLLAEAILAWGDAAPVRFAQRDDAWDFEILIRSSDDCDPQGCVLASAFFPDAGQHVLTIYPKMFTQDRQEQIETLAHEIGHVFGLRHFFALVSESAFPAVVYGTHVKFSIMNYGADSVLTDADRSDLKTLYEEVWSGSRTDINGTAIRLVRPFHDSGAAAGAPVLLAAGRSSG